MEEQYFDITRDDIPCEFQMSLGGVMLGFAITYNEPWDFFMIDIKDQLGNVILQGRKMVYKWNVLESITDPRLPTGLRLVPCDPAGVCGVFNWDTFGNVKIYIDWEE